MKNIKYILYKRNIKFNKYFLDKDNLIVIIKMFNGIIYNQR